MRVPWQTYLLAGFTCAVVGFALGLANVGGVALVLRTLLDLLAVVLIVVAYRRWRSRDVR